MALYELKYPSVPESEGVMLEAVKCLLSDNGVSGRELYNFLLVVSEGFTNALLHGNRNQPEKEIRVNIGININTLFADIFDQGQGGLEKIKNKCPSNLLSEGGRGINIMRYYATSVEFGETSDGGLKVTIKLDRKYENKVDVIDIQ